MSVPGFTSGAQGRLAAFLSAPERHAESMRYPELAGFVFVIACSPELIQPSEWVALLLHEDDPGYRDPAEAERVLGDLMALYNAVNEGVLTDTPALPLGCDWKEPVEAHFEANSPISQWSRGFADA